MSSAGEYLLNITDRLSDAGAVFRTNPVYKRNGEDTRGSVRGVASFTRGYRLHFTVFVDVSGRAPELLRYRYHFDTSDGVTIFRYDSSPHHAGVSSFPHHRHVGPDESVEASEEPTIEVVLSEIAAYLSREAG